MISLATAIILAASASPRAQGTKPSAPSGLEKLRQALGDKDVAARWIYGDLEAAKKEAERSKKPMLALFRCVP